MRHKIKIVVGCVLIITGFLATNIAVGQLTSLQNDTRTKCSGIVTEGGERYNIIEIAMNFAAIILLGVYCAKRIDNNLNIN